MRYSSFLLAVFVALAGCATAPPATEQHMIISPRTIIFPVGRVDTTISITHSCTCPFNWSAATTPDSTWLTIGRNFPKSFTGDNGAIHLSIDTSKLLKPQDSLTIRILSNAYGSDSIVIFATK